MQNSVLPLPDEHISSVVERFYVANGFENFDDFFMSLGLGRRRIKCFHDSYPQLKLYELIGIENYSEFFLDHTSYSFVAPFLPPYRQMKNLSGPFNIVGLGVLNYRFEGIKKCPICEQEDGYTKRSHNLPGVNCCYKHKVALTINNIPIKENINDKDVAYAIYAKEFADRKFDINSKTLNKYLDFKTNTFIDYEKGLKKLMELYPNIENFNPSIDKPTCDIDKNLYEVHSIRNNLLDLTCKICGTRFCTSIYGYENNFRCPACQSKLSDEELFKEHLSDEYILLSPYISKNDEISLKHIKCGSEFKTSPLKFYDGRRCLCEIRWIPSELAKEVEKNGDYEFIDLFPKEEKIKVKHLECNQEFLIGTRAFTNNRRCPYCEGLSEDKVKQRIEDMGFKLISKYSSFKEPITCICNNNHTFTKVYSNLTQRPYCPICKRLDTENKTSHQKLYRFLIENYKDDDLIFIKDLKQFTENKSILATLVGRNQIYRISDGIYSLTKLNLSVEEQIVKTYIEGKDIIGYPTKSYLLKTLGLKWNGVIHICTNKTDEKKEVYCRGKTFYIYPLPASYNPNKHSEHMIISFIDTGLYNANVPVIKEALYSFIKANKLDLSYIREHQNRSSKYAI